VKRFIATVLDLAILLVALLVLFALIVGGTLSLGTIRIGLRSVDNPVTILAAAVALRYLCRSWPSFGPLSGAAARIDLFATRTLAAFDTLSRQMPWPAVRRWVPGIALAALLLKAWFAATSPGFFSGDDVEIHEMSLSVLLGERWPIWDLRSPVFPLGFIFPAQWVAHVSGVTDVSALVVAGRLAVAVMSTVSVLLVAFIGRSLWPQRLGYAVLAAALCGFAKLSIAFGSSELPRPVASVFLLAAFFAIQRSVPAAAAVAGILVGTAASFRFSEILFVLPAAIHLVRTRGKTASLQFVLAAGGTMVLLIGLGDAAYWGEAFHSAAAAFDYTVVQRLSSRGYQPPWWYLTALGQWTTLPVFVLAVLGGARLRSLALWAFLPLAVLSVLPHKEARYAIPSVAFVCLLAAEGVRRVADGVANGAYRPWAAASLVAGLALGAVHDLGHYRLPRSNAEIAFARRLRSVELPSGVAVQQLWRLGGHLYLPHRPLIDLDPGQMSNPAYLANAVANGAAVVLDVRRGVDPATAAFLRDRGYVEQLADPQSGYALWGRPPFRAQ
jgi:hypothetical protein